jgi:hypothetical protein
VGDIFFFSLFPLLEPIQDTKYRRAKRKLDEMLQFQNLDSKIYKTAEVRMMERGKELKDIAKEKMKQGEEAAAMIDFACCSQRFYAVRRQLKTFFFFVLFNRFLFFDKAGNLYVANDRKPKGQLVLKDTAKLASGCANLATDKVAKGLLYYIAAVCYGRVFATG